MSAAALAAVLCAACVAPAQEAGPRKPAAIVEGYPAFDAKYYYFALRRQGVKTESFRKKWLDTKEYSKYGTVIISGDLRRARMEPNQYSKDDTERVRAFLTGGGTLILLRGNMHVFLSPDGKRFLDGLIGTAPRRPRGLTLRILKPRHPWLRHLDPKEPHPWVTARGSIPWFVRRGERIIGSRTGYATLCTVRLGKGRLIYLGWDVSRSQPHGRRPSTVAMERSFEEQINIILNMIADLHPAERERPPERKIMSDIPLETAPKAPTPIAGAVSPSILSHRPPRPLPAPSSRPMAEGPARFVDAARGDDRNAGSKDAPWKSLQHAVERLAPGDTLYLRGGIYYEHVTMTARGTVGKPITVRAYPGELAVIDGSMREFFERPAEMWEPCPGGVEGEYRSRRTYPDLPARAGRVNLMGRFADSMVSLHGYRHRRDLQTMNMFANVAKSDKTPGLYCGPGVWFNVETRRIHVRLAHTTLVGLREDNYRGETDPRKLRLVIAGGRGGPPLRIEGGRHLRLQDLVFRGALSSAVSVSNARDIEFDNVTLYGGYTCMAVTQTRGLRAVNCAFRGPAAPWTFRGSLKYRSVEANVFSASGWLPSGNSDFEMAWCEFTDSVDGIFIGNVANVRFHHNLVDNFSDDALFLTATTAYDGKTPGGNIVIYQNLFSRCLTTFAYGVGHGRQKAVPGGRQTGAGVWVFRNVFDLRRPVMYYQPTGPDAPQEIISYGRSAGDHGSPAWEPMFIYHNTIVARKPPFRSYYADGWGGHMHDTRRRIFNNIIVQIEGMPGSRFDPLDCDLATGGNLHWSVERGLAFQGDFVADLRRALATAVKRWKPPAPREKITYPKLGETEPGARAPVKALLKKDAPPPEPRRLAMPAWGLGDRFADPMFADFHSDWRRANDYRLRKGSPAIDAGVPVPPEWPDPLREQDKGKPDIGAFPLGCKPWGIGRFGRIRVAAYPEP